VLFLPWGPKQFSIVENYSLLSSGSRPQKSNEDASVDDDDGAMCSSSSSPSKKGIICLLLYSIV
jgi:hypothetical protein